LIREFRQQTNHQSLFRRVAIWLDCRFTSLRMRVSRSQRSAPVRPLSSAAPCQNLELEA
jgi:hypothetical protein